jgi:sulfur relay (sulfurtransferase) DsrC/TusE family protein
MYNPKETIPLPEDQMDRKFSDEELIKRLRDFYHKHGRSPTFRDMRGATTFEKRFGSWNTALEAADLPINKKSYVTDEEMIQALREFYEQNRRTPTLAEFPARGTIEQRFGTWNKALQAAGLPLNKKNKIPSETLLERLKSFFRHHGRSPTYAELEGAQTIQTRFGGWNNALKAAGLSLNVPKSHLKKAQVNANTIRDNARVMYAKYHGGPPQGCQVCGYDKFIMICHIRPVADFEDDATLEEINAPNNLVALCPNHHGELDRGLLQLP